MSPPAAAAPFTGGCQCGAVRYAFSEMADASFCHCRMCQRATGGLFAALVGTPKDGIVWTEGSPTLFASSSVAVRGFCGHCGTPLTFAYITGPQICVTIGSLDHPENAPIQIHYGVESRVPWLKLCDGLPQVETEDEAGSGANLATMTSHQGTVCG